MVEDIVAERVCFFDLQQVNTELTTAERVYHNPVKQDFCASFDSEWEGECAFPNIFRDGGKFRMYYMAGRRLDKSGTKHTIDDTFKICYMESSDGIVWEKPNLNICQFNGSKKNNIIIDKPYEFFVFKDTNPNCPADKLYKAIYNKEYRLYCMFSEDGLHFREGGIISDIAYYDTLNTAFFDNAAGKYVSYVRGFHMPDQSEFPDYSDKEEFKKYAHIRDIRVMYSDDFLKWTRPERISFNGDFKDIQLYTNCISIYYRAPQYYIGFPSRYIENKQWTKSYDNLCGKEARLKRFNIMPRYGLALTDCIFMASSDGKNWERSDRAFISPGIERADGWLYGDGYPASGLVETVNKLYGHKELSIYCPEGYWAHNCKIARYTIRLDGFVSYSAGDKPKVITTKPFKFKGGKLYMNLSTSAYGTVNVCISDENGRETNSGEIFGDDIDKEIWFLQDDLKEFEGETVTMRITLKDADIYSYRFVK